MKSISLHEVLDNKAVDLSLIENAKRLNDFNKEKSLGVKSSDFSISHPFESELYRKATQSNSKPVASLLRVPNFSF